MMWKTQEYFRTTVLCDGRKPYINNNYIEVRNYPFLYLQSWSGNIARP